MQVLNRELEVLQRAAIRKLLGDVDVLVNWSKRQQKGQLPECFAATQNPRRQLGISDKKTLLVDGLKRVHARRQSKDEETTHFELEFLRSCLICKLNKAGCKHSTDD